MTATPSEPVPSRRLHGSSLIFRLFPLIQSFLVPALLVFFLSSDGRWQLWLPLLILPAFLIELYRTRTLRYRLEEDELVITTGRWFRNERHIPYTRIQNIDLVQGPLHRLLSVGEVRLETASGAGAEAKLIVLSRSAEIELREAVAQGRYAAGVAQAEPAEDGQADALAEEEVAAAIATPPKPILRLSFGELARIAVDPGRSLIPLGVLFGLGWEFDLFERFQVWNRVEEWFEAGGLGYGWLDGLLLAVAAFVLLTLFSLIGTTLLFYGFELRQVDEQFRIRRGLLTKVRATVPRRRIQLVSVHQSLIHRWMDRVRVRVGTAGQGSSEEEDGQEESWLAPLCSSRQVEGLLREIDARFVASQPDWRPFPRAALRRARRRAVRWGVLLAGILLAAWKWTDEVPDAALYALPIPLVWLWLTAGWSHRRRAFAMDRQRLVLQEGWWKRRTTYVLMEKVQSVECATGIFDRRWQQAHLHVDTAGGNATGHRFALHWLTCDTAQALQEEIVARAARARFRWS